MSESMKVLDRRKDERIIVHGQVQFCTLSNNDYRGALLEDFSQLGMLLYLDDEFSVGSKIKIRVEPSEDESEQPLEFTVEIVRIADQSVDNRTGYGCRIIEHNFLH